MPMSYRIDPHDGVALLSASGTLTDDEMIDCVARLRADPALAPGMPTLSDMRGVTELQITSDGIQQMFDMMTKTEPNRGDAQAAIVTGNDLTFGMARMMSMMGDAKHLHPHFRAFHDMPEARAWLGLGGDNEDGGDTENDGSE